ncbi:phage replisome organizer N-terminal domain-containing protein [uncultured Veillonella sp.]|uniref:phage replisome organizer N-terminal domain-containing protein n=1 Tax=uncultured Veillonella sp. TaxID=159268 RepID=UPI0028062D99|nr:phage replisome organizer N-terminal domain-containing protein [uncultured Veillonella sp.]
MAVLTENDIINEDARKRFNKQRQVGENCKFIDVLNQVRSEHGLPPIHEDNVVDDTKELTKDDKQAYFWWKFKHDFFDDIGIKRLSKLPKGDTFILLYIKLITLALKCNGYICYEGIGISLNEEISLHLDRDIEECTELIEVLEKYNLITLIDDNETIYIKSFNTYTGVDDAKTRMRNSRERNKQQKNALS